MIIVDDREIRSGICDELNLLEIPFEVRRLDVGDYIINKTIFIERKTTADFIESLKDRRLLNQAAKLRKGGKRALMIIEGYRLVGNASVRGALCSISVKCFMPILRSTDIKGTAWILNHIHDYNEDKDFIDSFCTHDFRKKHGVASMQERMLMQMRQVGPGLARQLIMKFETIDRIINATDEELLEVNGIGKQLIMQIRLLRNRKKINSDSAGTPE